MRTHSLPIGGGGGDGCITHSIKHVFAIAYRRRSTTHKFALLFMGRVLRCQRTVSGQLGTRINCLHMDQQTYTKKCYANGSTCGSIIVPAHVHRADRPFYIAQNTFAETQTSRTDGQADGTDGTDRTTCMPYGNDAYACCECL